MGSASSLKPVCCGSGPWRGRGDISPIESGSGWSSLTHPGVAQVCRLRRWDPGAAGAEAGDPRLGWVWGESTESLSPAHLWGARGAPGSPSRLETPPTGTGNPQQGQTSCHHRPLLPAWAPRLNPISFFLLFWPQIQSRLSRSPLDLGVAQWGSHQPLPASSPALLWPRQGPGWGGGSPWWVAVAGMGDRCEVIWARSRVRGDWCGVTGVKRAARGEVTGD